MRGTPESPPPVVRDLIAWARACEVTPLAPDRVPGAQGLELRHLAALGALARGLSPAAVHTWPEPLASWARDAELEVNHDLLRKVKQALQDSHHDILALAYEGLVHAKNRRRLGTFFTPDSIVRHMIEQCKGALADEPAQVVDPGAGVGAFALAAHAAWPSALVTAVDINVVTLGLLAARTQSGTQAFKPDRLELAPVDYLAWLSEKWPSLAGPRLVLGNPPYTRHQLMTAKDKGVARRAAGDLVTSGLAGLSAYFLAASLRALAPEDALCLLLPAPWCETRYGRELRVRLWSSTNRRVEVHLFPSEAAVFPGTQVTAMVLMVGPHHDQAQPFVVRRARLSTMDAEERVVLDTPVRSNRSAPCPPTFTGLLRLPVRSTRVATVRLEEIGKVRRGVATGASSYFFLTDEQRDTHRLPERALRPALVKPAHCLDDDLTVMAHDTLGRAGFPRWLLDLNDKNLEDNEHLAAYLALGKELGVHLTHLAAQRQPWQVVEHVRAPDLFLAPVGRGTHRVLVNSARAVGSNNVYGIYLDERAPWGPAVLARWLRSRQGQRGLTALAREYQGGSLKIEPGSLRGLVIPVQIAGRS